MPKSRRNPANSSPLGRLMAAICLAVASFGTPTVWAAIDVPTNCIQHEVISGSYDQYFELDAIGNQRTEDAPVDLVMYIGVQNMEEEIAFLLSHQDRSFEYPDFARTYEVRVGNVYTVIYRETLKMKAYHSATNKLFPGDQFKIHFRILKEGNVTITLDDNTKKPLLNVFDEAGPLDVRYISFASRMNAYPIVFHFACNQEVSSTEPGPRSEALSGCPVCPKQKCEVIVRACTDNSKDGAATDPTKQRYYFNFNMYLSKNKGKAVEENLLV
ncbi:uncharacterized protein LOC120417686 [Culex pipiens pallens]|uniref:uncharacterized protein LOC120417686 n=1 Tax=Culex pipiens pallens TaxID=42434 RepID=UPI0019540AC6|nr:uncharacterized protein LOC120417686 [Culex pipiens pallens]